MIDAVCTLLKSVGAAQKICVWPSWGWFWLLGQCHFSPGLVHSLLTVSPVIYTPYSLQKSQYDCPQMSVRWLITLIKNFYSKSLVRKHCIYTKSEVFTLTCKALGPLSPVCYSPSCCATSPLSATCQEYWHPSWLDVLSQPRLLPSIPGDYQDTRYPCYLVHKRNWPNNYWINHFIGKSVPCLRFHWI